LSLAAPYLDRYGYAGIFGALFLEAFGLPLPGEAMLIAGAIMASQGTLHVVPLMIAAWIAAVLGDNIGYAIGRFGGRQLVLRHGRHLGITGERLDRVERLFGRFGGAVVLAARFFVLLRQLNGLVAGTLGMEWWRFAAFNGTGAALWVAVWALGVYALGRDIGHILPWMHGIGLAAGLALLGLAVLLLVFLLYRRRAGSLSR
jgi:membrane protein DedA with SNARE-associated domain